MSATRDGKMWRCQFYYKDWQGVSHKKNKRGFKTKAEACVLLTQKRNEKDYEFEIEVSLMIDSDRLFEDSRPTYTNIRKYVFDKY